MSWRAVLRMFGSRCKIRESCPLSPSLIELNVSQHCNVHCIDTPPSHSESTINDLLPCFISHLLIKKCNDFIMSSLHVIPLWPRKYKSLLCIFISYNILDFKYILMISILIELVNKYWLFISWESVQLWT